MVGGSEEGMGWAGKTELGRKEGKSWPLQNGRLDPCMALYSVRCGRYKHYTRGLMCVISKPGVYTSITFPQLLCCTVLLNWKINDRENW